MEAAPRSPAPITRLLLCAAHLAVLFAIVVGLPDSASGDSVREVRSDADWIIAGQLPDGAIANYVDRAAIWPYVANFAAIGLAKAAQITGAVEYSDSAWRWLRWYETHQDLNGFVNDYNVTAGAEVSSGGMDSTDAYAGTFLLAVEAVWQATHDDRQLRGLETGMTAAVAAIESTQGRDGLTWAKPSWHVKYLMDQAETYGGLRAAESLAVALGDLGLAGRAEADAGRLRRGVQRLWNPVSGAYDWALHERGIRHTTNWRVLYPDAAEQASAVAFGLVSGPRAHQLMNRFARAQPNWDRPAEVALYDSGFAPVGYLPVVAMAFARIGDGNVATVAVERLRQNALVTDRAWPFTPLDAGELIALTGPSRTSSAIG